MTLELFKSLLHQCFIYTIFRTDFRMNDSNMSAVTTSLLSVSLPHGVLLEASWFVSQRCFCEAKEMWGSIGRQKVSEESTPSLSAEASQEAPVCSPLNSNLTDASLRDYVFWLFHLFVIAAAGLLWLDHELKIIFSYAVTVGCIWFRLKRKSIM